ncbi:hypothetical protein [uncultured Bartonella sp.]|uniref:hypothetical protein n=1 Tax=uncultured Bartonella sp. TaxID=104108 RepID=UPI0026214C03|nr:hypothetical protein [uncultured Bartonella sp.]
MAIVPLISGKLCYRTDVLVYGTRNPASDNATSDTAALGNATSDTAASGCFC